MNTTLVSANTFCAWTFCLQTLCISARDGAQHHVAVNESLGLVRVLHSHTQHIILHLEKCFKQTHAELVVTKQAYFGINWNKLFSSAFTFIIAAFVFKMQTDFRHVVVSWRLQASCLHVALLDWLLKLTLAFFRRVRREQTTATASFVLSARWTSAALRSSSHMSTRWKLHCFSPMKTQ